MISRCSIHGRVKDNRGRCPRCGRLCTTVSESQTSRVSRSSRSSDSDDGPGFITGMVVGSMISGSGGSCYDDGPSFSGDDGDFGGGGSDCDFGGGSDD